MMLAFAQLLCLKASNMNNHNHVSFKNASFYDGVFHIFVESQQFNHS